MKRTFCCLLHASDCVEEVEVVVEKIAGLEHLGDEEWVRTATYRLVSYPSTCKCGGYVPHSDPPQEVLRAAYHANDAEEV